MVEGEHKWWANFYLEGDGEMRFQRRQWRSSGGDRNDMNNVIQRIMKEKLKVNVKGKSKG